MFWNRLLRADVHGDSVPSYDRNGTIRVLRKSVAGFYLPMCLNRLSFSVFLNRV